MRQIRNILLLATLLVIFSVTSLPAHAGNAVVTNCNNAIGPGTMEDAINTANSGGGTITFACSGIVYMDEEDIYNNVVINGGGTITLYALYGHFNVHSGASLTLNGLVLESGDAYPGGSINNDGTLTITNSSFWGNMNGFGGAGGAIYNTGTMTVNNSFFFGNQSDSAGAIYNTGSVIATNTTFSNNNGFGGANGSAVYNSGTFTSIGSTFLDNTIHGIYNVGVFSSQNTQFTNNACVGNAIVDNGGNSSVNSSGCPGQFLTVAPLGCSGNNLVVNITNGDANFHITGTGPNLPQLNVGLGNHIFNGPGTWTGVTVTETVGDIQIVNMGNITCPSQLSTCDFASLSAAVTNANVGGGVIDFNCSGTIIFTNQLTISNSVTINANGNTVIFDGGNTTRHFTVNGGASLSLNGFTLRDGNAQLGFGGSINSNGTLNITNSTFSSNVAPDPSANGGAIYSNTGTITLNNTNFSNNSAAQGGGAITAFGTLNITGGSFNNNSATNYGGAIEIHGTTTITGTTFTDNMAVFGGAIANLENLMITNGTFTSNDSSLGGAIYSQAGVNTVSSSTFTSNTAGVSGGAIHNQAGTMNISNSTFTSNTGSFGGAFTNNATATSTNTTFSGNSTPTDGGAIFNTVDGTLTISGGTFSNNVATNSAGAIFNEAPGVISSLSATYIGDATNNTCVGTITDNGGNTRTNSAGCPGTGFILLNIGSLTCSGDNLVLNIANGDANFNITGTGPNLPRNNVGTGSQTINGPGTWTGITVTELSGDFQSVNLGDRSCFTPIAVNASAVCNGLNLDVTITGGNGPFDITATTGGGVPLTNVATGLHTLSGNGVWTGVTITEKSGDLEVLNLGNFDCSTPLVTTAVCNGYDLRVTITGGDAPFNITATTGAGVPLNNVGTGVYDLVGLTAWSNVTVTETTGNTQALNLGNFTCTTPLVTTAVCNGYDLRVTITGGDAPFNITATTGAGVPLNNVAAGVYDLVGLTTWTDVTVTETTGNTQSLNLGNFSCNIPLNTTITCVGNDLVVNIIGGDGTFNIAGTGTGLPLTNVVANSYTFTGPGTWTGVSVSENTGNNEFTVPADFTCQTVLTANAVCNNGNLDVNILTGDANFNITGTGAGLPANGVGLGVTTLNDDALGVNSWTGVTVTEIGGNAETIALGDFNCNKTLVASAVCNGTALEVTTTAGDVSFNISDDSGSLLAGVGLGMQSITGPIVSNNLTVTETGGDAQSLNLGNYNCSNDLATTATCDANGDLAINITAGDGAIFDITGTGLGLPTTGGLGLTTRTGNNLGPNTWMGVTVTELSGDLDTLNLGDVTCNRPLDVTAVCLGNDLQVTINNGDVSFDIADGMTALPAGTGVGLGAITFAGPIIITDLTITEIGGDTQNISLGAFNCFVSNTLTVTSTCNGADLDITISNGNAPFTVNVTTTSGVLSLTSVALGTYGFTGPDTFTNISIVEESGDLETLNFPALTCPTPVLPPAPVVLPPDPNALGCAITTEVDLSNVLDNTYCRVLMRNGGVVGYAGAVPQQLVNFGVIFAVDVYQMEGGATVNSFPNYTRICLNGAGRLFYMDSRNAPRRIVELTTEIEGSLTCGWIPAPGTLILTN